MVRYAFILLFVTACHSPCETSTVRCHGKKCQVCIDDGWATARTCKEECFIQEDVK